MTASFTYNPGTWTLAEVAVTGGHQTKLTYDGLGRVVGIDQIETSPASNVQTSLTYSAPTSALCESEDVGETTVSGGQDEEEQVYCYNAAGEVTNEIESD